METVGPGRLVSEVGDYSDLEELRRKDGVL